MAQQGGLEMSIEREIAETYRQRAVELRAIAAMDGQSKTCEILKQVADDYDHMATNLDDIATTNEAMHRR